MWRVAVYAHETPGRHGRARLDRQVARLAVRRRPPAGLVARGHLRRPVPRRGPPGRACPLCAPTRRAASTLSWWTAGGACLPTATSVMRSSPD